MRAEDFFDLAGQYKVSYRKFYRLDSHITIIYPEGMKEELGDFSIIYFNCKLNFSNEDNGILKKLFYNHDEISLYCKPDAKSFRLWHSGRGGPKLKVYAIEKDGKVIAGSKDKLEKIISHIVQ